MKYTCIIIDDETHAIQGLERYIATMPEFEILKTYNDPLKALKEIKNGSDVDVIFLDIDMPMINGIELAKEIREKTDKLVFTTGHTEHAFDAFEAQASAYLLKPFSLGKFVIAINKLFPTQVDMEQEFQAVDAEKNADFFFVKSKSEKIKLVKIRFDDVISIESKLNYILITTLKDKLLTYMTLGEIGKTLLIHSQFIQVHRSYIINCNHIESIEGNMIKMADNVIIAIGDYYRKAFNGFIGQRVIKGTKN